mgnify:CR=1 FL=1
MVKRQQRDDPGVGGHHAADIGGRFRAADFRRRLDQFQFATLVFQMCRPIWQRWLQTAALSGALNMPNFARDPSRYTAVKWITPKWEWVDPLKDRQAEKIAQEQGWKAPSDIIEAEGNDVDETYNRIAADQKRREELGIKLAQKMLAAGGKEILDELIEY